MTTQPTLAGVVTQLPTVDFSERASRIGSRFVRGPEEGSHEEEAPDANPGARHLASRPICGPWRYVASGHELHQGDAHQAALDPKEPAHHERSKGAPRRQGIARTTGHRGAARSPGDTRD